MKFTTLASSTALALIIAILATGTPAQAMHAYAQDDCVTKLMNGRTLEINLSNGQPADPHWIAIDDDSLSSDDKWVNFDRVINGTDENPKTSALVLITKARSKTTDRKTSDGCFEGSEGNYTQTVQVSAVSAKLVKAGFDLKRGQILNFVCYSQFIAPTGKHCGE